jgi:predicted phosphoribosyltransferase
MFLNRTDAGKQVAQRLLDYKNQEGVVLAVPRGGVVIGFEVAKALDWPMDLLLIKKLGHPKNKEYAIGAASLTDKVIVPHSEVSDEYIENETRKVRERLKEMRFKFLGDQAFIQIEEKVVIIVDDGIATGNTILASIELLKKQKPKKIIIAVPVAPERAVETLRKEVDELIVLDVPESFYGIGQFYEDFTQVSDEEVINDLERINRYG